MRILFVIAALAGASTYSRAAEGSARAIASFESLGLYYDRPAVQDGCRVHYRAAGAGEWREGYPLVYDARERQYRGSLVGLRPDTLYDIRFEAGGTRVEIQARTRGEEFPIGKTTWLPGGTGDQTIYIREGGTATGWHLVTPKAGTRFTGDVFNLSDYNVVVEADYVILRGLELKNAAIHGIFIRRGVQNVVVEDCRITRWGRFAGSRAWGLKMDMDSGIYADRGAGRLVIQRNLIEHPRGGSSDWEAGHPEGPQAISMINSSGENIIRYNTIRSTEDHGYNDGIGGASNFSFEGSPNRDSDIYGNIISNCWDDCIESEGANRNVRIWSNYIHHTFVDIATAATAMGPIYIFRNVFGESRVTHRDPAGGNIIKTGAHDVVVNGERVSTALGYRFIFHNTALQPHGPLNGITGSTLHNAVSRNNIFYSYGRAYPQDAGEPRNDFQNDLTGPLLGGGGLVQSMFLPSQTLEWFLTPTANRVQVGRVANITEKVVIDDDPVVAVKNPALDAGARLPGFNDDYAGTGPDIGAFENGRPPLRFGREMAPGFTRPPWEAYP